MHPESDYGRMIGGSFCECLGGCAACGLLRKNFPQSSAHTRPKRISWGYPLKEPLIKRQWGQIDFFREYQSDLLIFCVGVTLPHHLAEILVIPPQTSEAKYQHEIGALLEISLLFSTSHA
jgi:hypothetical protein